MHISKGAESGKNNPHRNILSTKNTKTHKKIKFYDKRLKNTPDTDLIT
jgi:hypothetical protein